MYYSKFFSIISNISILRNKYSIVDVLFEQVIQIIGSNFYILMQVYIFIIYLNNNEYSFYYYRTILLIRRCFMYKWRINDVRLLNIFANCTYFAYFPHVNDLKIFNNTFYLRFHRKFRIKYYKMNRCTLSRTCIRVIQALVLYFKLHFTCSTFFSLLLLYWMNFY